MVKDIIINCEKHGKVTVHEFSCNGMSIVSLCPFCIAEKERQEAELEAIQNKARQERIWREENVALEYQGKTIDDVIITDGNREAVDAVKQLIDGRLRNVIISGGCGTGKTLLGSIAVMAIGGIICSVLEISLRIRATYSPSSSETEYGILQSLIDAPMLVIDELGRSAGSDAEQNWLSFVIDKRHSQRLRTMILSNLPLAKTAGTQTQSLEHGLGTAIVSRMRESGVAVVITGADYRKQRRQA